MEPFLPSLQNLPVFYTVLVSLLLLFGLSGFSLYIRLRRQPPNRLQNRSGRDRRVLNASIPTGY